VVACLFLGFHRPSRCCGEHFGSRKSRRTAWTSASSILRPIARFGFVFLFAFSFVLFSSLFWLLINLILFFESFFCNCPGRNYNISVQTVSNGEISLPTTAQYRTVPLRPRNVTFDRRLVTYDAFQVRWEEPKGVR